MKGETKTWGWETGERSYTLPTIPGANMQITYLRSRFNPFLVLDDRDGVNDRKTRGPAILRTGGDRWSNRVGLPWCDHWPVTQIPVLMRFAQAADRPSHTWTSTQYSAPFAVVGNAMTKIMLCGLTDKPIEALLPLARSWLRPAALSVESTAVVSEGYDPTQRAYVLRCREPGRPGEVALTVNASEASPLLAPAFVLKDWGEPGVRVAVNGEPLPRGDRLRYGHNRHLDGTDMVLWLDIRSTSGVRILLTPVRPAE